MMLIPCFATLFFLFELSGRRGVLAETDKELGDVYKRLYDFGLGKRAAYSYVSEYKRLPVYNFGLGKRASNERLYSFGLGKRDYDLEDEYDDDVREDFVKRGKQYAFGLGSVYPSNTASASVKGPRVKCILLDSESDLRSRNTSFTTTRAKTTTRPKNGKGRRRTETIDGSLSESENVTRTTNAQGKKRSMHYNFGLGKRSQSMQEKETAHSSSLVN